MRVHHRPILPLLIIFAAALVSLAGCAARGPQPLQLRDVSIGNDTTWSGEVVIDGTVKVARNATLTILPGTDVVFVRRDRDADGLGDGTLVVEGRFIALGTVAEPIVFRSGADDPQPGDWLELRVDFSREVRMRYCELRDSAYTLHAHFTRGVVEDSHIHHNIDGCRLGQATFTFRNNLIEQNQGKGINFRNSRVEVHHNIIRDNGSGIFLFENDREFDIHHNNLYGNLENVRLGDFYTGEVHLRDNWWGTGDLTEARATIYDRARDPSIGRVFFDPAPSWVAETGIRDAVSLTPAWSYATAGYVDADLVTDEERLYAASWDGRLHVLGADGRLHWTRNLGDTIDATPALAADLLVVQTWSREVYALDRRAGTTRWRFDYSPSRADDHRQGGALVVDGMVLVPAWNGTLFALAGATGEKLWEFAGGQPLRARPVADGRTIYLAAGDGTLSALDRQGENLWSYRAVAPLLSPPALLPEGVAVLDRDGRLAVFDRAGSRLWEHDLGETCYYGAPVYHDRALYVPTAAGALWKFEAATGRRLWRVATSGPVYATPLVADGRIFLGDNSGTMQVIDADSGTLLATYRVEREIQGKARLWEGRLVFGSRDHKVHALDLAEDVLP